MKADFTFFCANPALVLAEPKLSTPEEAKFKKINDSSKFQNATKNLSESLSKLLLKSVMGLRTHVGFLSLKSANRLWGKKLVWCVTVLSGSNDRMVALQPRGFQVLCFWERHLPSYFLFKFIFSVYIYILHFRFIAS